MKTTYSDHQYDMLYPIGIEYHWWTLSRNQLVANILRRESGDTSVFLEVGCGKGVVVKNLRDCGFNIQGVELADVKPVDGAQEWVEAGTDAFEWAIERRSEITGMLLLDVIEHLPEPEPFLKKLANSFPNLAVVIITVPACHEVWSPYDAFCGHYRRYSLEMLDKLAIDLNWKTKSSGYFFHTPYVLMRLMSLLGIERNTQINAPGTFMRPLHQIVSAICRLEQILVPRRIKGSSAYAVYHPAKAGRE